MTEFKLITGDPESQRMNEQMAALAGQGWEFKAMAVMGQYHNQLALMFERDDRFEQ